MLTANSKKNIDELLEELRVFRQQGFSTEHQEASETSNCIAMPIVQNGKMIASFSCTFSTEEMESVNINTVVEMMRNCKQEIESRLELLL
jgi:DNA-binding IclR family transcriptional regulator